MHGKTSGNTRHHVVSRLSRYFQVVWVYPDEASGELRKKAGIRADRFDPGQQTAAFPGPGFMVYRPEFWLRRLYRIPRAGQPPHAAENQASPEVTDAARLSENHSLHLASFTFTGA